MEFFSFFFLLHPYQQAIIGAVIGIVPCWLWGEKGGDNIFDGGFFSRHLTLANVLRALHHWELGIIIFAVGILLYGLVPWSHYIVGFGAGTFFDDFLFHSFENYFRRSSDD